MQLFEGFVDGHEGTYMEAFGLAFHQFRVNVSLTNECDMAGKFSHASLINDIEP